MGYDLSVFKGNQGSVLVLLYFFWAAQHFWDPCCWPFELPTFHHGSLLGMLFNSLDDNHYVV